MKSFFIKAVDFFGNCDFYFDALSPMGMKIAKKRVFKKGGMGMDGEGWGIKPVKSLEKWDSRIKIVNRTPMNKGMKKGLPFKTKLTLTIGHTRCMSNGSHENYNALIIVPLGFIC